MNVIRQIKGKLSDEHGEEEKTWWKISWDDLRERAAEETITLPRGYGIFFLPREGSTAWNKSKNPNRKTASHLARRAT